VSNDAAIIGGLVRWLSGTCRVCGCHGDSCALREGGGERCVWVDKLKTLCNSEACIAADAISKKNHKRDLRRGDQRAKAAGFRPRSTRRNKSKKVKGRAA
jgi:hypothetical protein